ncbi:hypothetical protein TNCV_4286901 [Trichonephila clavipes]|nr:hypothetical protein TNCV_4286901 [Trichonephila clavipes]
MQVFHVLYEDRDEGIKDAREQSQKESFEEGESAVFRLPSAFLWRSRFLEVKAFTPTATTSDCDRNHCGREGHGIPDTSVRRIIERPQANPLLSVEASRIPDVRSSTVVNGQRRLIHGVSKGLRYGERGGKTTGLPLPIYLRGYVSWRWLRTGIEKCAATLSCVDQTS